MTFTGQLGTDESMPGNIALGQSQSEGGGTGGPGPTTTTATVTIPQAEVTSDG